MTKHTGSCHCGAMAFELEAEIDEAMECNCSICRRKGYLLSFAPLEALNVTTPQGAVTTYSFGKHTIQHQFCKICGCAPFGTGEMPDGTKMAAVNVRCIPEIDLADLKITHFDGASL